MGGSIAFTLRLEDGTEYRMCRWTNILPWAITNKKMIEKDPSHIQKVLENWLKMKDDYERNKDSGNFENNMTDVYFPFDLLAPTDYGLVVVDFVNNVILESQGYTEIGRIYGSVSPCDDNFYELQSLFESGRIRQCETETGIVYIDPSKSFNEFLSDIQSLHSLIVDMSPLTIESFSEHDYKEHIMMRERILELGFKLNNEDEEGWSEWINELKEEWESESD